MPFGLEEDLPRVTADSSHQAGGDFLPVIFLHLDLSMPSALTTQDLIKAPGVQISLLTSRSVIPTPLTPPSALRLCFLSSWNHSSASKSLIHSFFFSSPFLKEIYLAEPGLSYPPRRIFQLWQEGPVPDRYEPRPPDLGAWSLLATGPQSPLILFTYQLLCGSQTLFKERFGPPSILLSL